jgi:serine/threonine protein kinase
MNPGDMLGPYQILASIGAGGMGEVYRARDARLERDVAIKVLPAAVSADETRLRRFQLEARAASALNHPNILTVYDIGVHGGAPYLVTELLEGQTLAQHLGTRPLPVAGALDIAL